jgi:hypothetical protein
MGTSAARRGPRGPRWSLARRAATRYLAGEESGLPAVRELAARYVAALEETALEEGRDLLGAFRLTRKVAQNLGDFLTQAHSPGWEAALAGGGWGGGGGGAFTPAAMAAAVEGSGDGSIEAAVARTALAQVLRESLGAASPEASDPAQAVRRFLAEALYLRLASDLGETLEAAGQVAAGWRGGMAILQRWLRQTAEALPPPPPLASQWQGLTGWVWVTRNLEELLERIRGQGAVVETGPVRS